MSAAASELQSSRSGSTPAVVAVAGADFSAGGMARVAVGTSFSAGRASAVVVRVVMADWANAPPSSSTHASGGIGGRSPSALTMVPDGTAVSAPWLCGTVACSATVCPSGDRATGSASSHWSCELRAASWAIVWFVTSRVRRSTGFSGLVVRAIAIASASSLSVSTVIRSPSSSVYFSLIGARPKRLDTRCWMVAHFWCLGEPSSSGESPCGRRS